MTAATIVAMMGSSMTNAGVAVSVLDLDNLVVNTTTMASNIAQNFQLTAIRDTLMNAHEGTTVWNIDKSTHNLVEYNMKNYEIDVDFTWIINGRDGEEIIPIPYKQKLDRVMGGQNAEEYSAHYKTVEDYKDIDVGQYGQETALESSRARKAANDALVDAIAHDEMDLMDEASALKELSEMSVKAQGHGHQLQVANALAGSQINQLMRMRSMMLVSEAARAAEAQGAADRDARAVAVSARMRSGLDNAIDQSVMPAPAY